VIAGRTVPNDANSHEYFDGDIDNWKLWDVALTAEQVMALYSEPPLADTIGSCPSGFSNATSGYCYAAVSAANGTTWYEAQDACAALGSSAGATLATLASIRDPSQRSIVLDQRCAGLGVPQNLADAAQAIWVGYWDEGMEGEWQWESGADPAWFNATAPWTMDEPSNSTGKEDCAFVLPSSGGEGLHAAPCASRNATSSGVDYRRAGCCEVPVQPAIVCPQGFTGPDAAGYCYASLGTAAGYTWDEANSACRALGNGSALAAIIDSVTNASVVTERCAGTVPGVSNFWTGIRDTSGGLHHTDRAGNYWRNYGSGHRNDWFIRNGAGAWGSGEPNS
jgi:hypothetical protein